MTLYFAEERAFDGKWRPCTYTYRPPEKGPEGRNIKRRSVTLIPCYHRHLTLDQLANVYGENGRLRATQKGAAPCPR